MRRLTVVAILLAVVVARAAAESRQGARFLNLPLSVRQMGMGDVTMGGQDLLRAWTNPAVLAGQERVCELAMSAASNFGGDQPAGGFGLGWHLAPGWVVGGMVAYSSMSGDDLDVRGAPTGKTLNQDVRSAGFTSAWRFGFARLGATFKLVSEDLAGDVATSSAADLGLAVFWKRVSAGAAVRNLARDLRPAEAGSPVAESLPSEVRAGAAYLVERIGLGVGVEYGIPKGLNGSGAAGLEWWPKPWLGMRAGVKGVGGRDGLALTAGLSGTYRGIGLDYSLGTHPLGFSNRVSLSCAFGQPAAEAPYVFGFLVRGLAPAALRKPVQGQLNLAVANMDPQGVSASDAAVISDLLRTELVRTREVNIVEKQHMEKLLAEQAFQQTGCTSEECAVKLGKILNVHVIVVGSFGKLLDNYFLSVRVVSVENGNVVFADAVTGRNTGDFPAALSVLAKRIVNNFK